MKISNIARILTAQGLTLSTAESCTGGLIAHTITNLPGSSAFFSGGMVCYSNESKTNFLKVPAEIIKKHGAVSKPVAQKLAEGALQHFKTDFALATTGIAGPAGGTDQKPVGLVFIALASPKNTIVKKCFFTGTRKAIKTQACHTALRLLHQTLSLSTRLSQVL